VYSISFDQKFDDQKYTLYKGEIYLDSASLAFVKISYGISPKGRGHRTLPWEIELFMRLRKGIVAQLVVRDVNVEYEKINGYWVITKLEQMNVTNWENNRKTIPKLQIINQRLILKSIDNKQPTRLVNKDKLLSPKPLINQTIPYDAEFWKDYNPPE
jgi:hypothetical protein